jgi:hypothetical protein
MWHDKEPIQVANTGQVRLDGLGLHTANLGIQIVPETLGCGAGKWLRLWLRRSGALMG